MSVRQTSIKIFSAIKSKSAQSLRSVANKIDQPKSTVHRHHIKQQERIQTVGHDFFETESGNEFLKQLLLAVVFIFGIQAGVGAETISLFFTTMVLHTYLAVSSSSIRKQKNNVRGMINQYGDEQMREVYQRSKNLELHLGGDETFGSDKLYLVLSDLPSNFIFEEILTDSRSFESWRNNLKEFLSLHSKNIKSLGTDGAKALKKLGSYIGCPHIMDLFHGMNDLKKHFSTKFHSMKQSIMKKIRNVEQDKTLSSDEKDSLIKEHQAKIKQIDDGQQLYRKSLFMMSTTVHPFKEVNKVQTSSELELKITETHEKLTHMSQSLGFKDKAKLLNRFEGRIKGMSILNDHWHQWVNASAAEVDDDPQAQQWAKEILLPLVYWENQLDKSKKKKSLRDYYKEQIILAKKSFDESLGTQIYMDEDWINWAKKMARKYQRTTSAIEGRNAQLSSYHWSSRGARLAHSKPQTILHNFWIKRVDGSTACHRLCGYDPSDLFQWLMDQSPDIPMPRAYKSKSAA